MCLSGPVPRKSSMLRDVGLCRLCGLRSREPTHPYTATGPLKPPDASNIKKKKEAKPDITNPPIYPHRLMARIGDR